MLHLGFEEAEKQLNFSFFNLKNLYLECAPKSLLPTLSSRAIQSLQPSAFLESVLEGGVFVLVLLWLSVIINVTCACDIV